jgi:hypothetical protein
MRLKDRDENEILLDGPIRRKDLDALYKKLIPIIVDETLKFVFKSLFFILISTFCIYALVKCFL